MSTSPDHNASASAHRDALAPFRDETERLRPAGAELFDAHTHLGLDEDGRSLDVPSLLSMMDQAGVGRACTFPLHDPERRPAYRLPNDRVLRWAAESEGRLIPFCRLDPLEEPLEEAARCLAAGARGIKLHPRAQSFTFRVPELTQALEGIFGLAEEARVPILIHAGRGLPPIADGLVDLALRHPGTVLILAHAAICDQGVLTAGLADHPGVLYDTSCFSPVDVVALCARVPAERIVLGSDPPYGRPLGGLYLALRAAQHAGMDELATRAIAGETMAALFDGPGLPDPRPPRGDGVLAMSTRLARVYSYGCIAGPALFGGMIERAREAIELALAACHEPAQGPDSEALAVIGAALAAALVVLAGDDGIRPALELLQHAIVRASTEVIAPSAIAPPTPRRGAAPAHAAQDGG